MTTIAERAGSTAASQGFPTVATYIRDWAERLPDGNWEIFYGVRPAQFSYRATLPLVMFDFSR